MRAVSAEHSESEARRERDTARARHDEIKTKRERDTVSVVTSAGADKCPNMRGATEAMQLLNEAKEQVLVSAVWCS